MPESPPPLKPLKWIGNYLKVEGQALLEAGQACLPLSQSHEDLNVKRDAFRRLRRELGRYMPYDVFIALDSGDGTLPFQAVPWDYTLANIHGKRLLAVVVSDPNQNWDLYCCSCLRASRCIPEAERVRIILEGRVKLPGDRPGAASMPRVLQTEARLRKGRGTWHTSRGRTDKTLADWAGVGKSTVHRVRKVLESGDRKLRQAMLAGQIGITEAYEMAREADR